MILIISLYHQILLSETVGQKELRYQNYQNTINRKASYVLLCSNHQLENLSIKSKFLETQKFNLAKNVGPTDGRGNSRTEFQVQIKMHTYRDLHMYICTTQFQIASVIANINCEFVKHEFVDIVALSNFFLFYYFFFQVL